MTPQQANEPVAYLQESPDKSRHHLSMVSVMPPDPQYADWTCTPLYRRAPAPTEPAVDRDSAHYARLTLIRASSDEALIEALKIGKVSIHAALLQVLGAAPASPVAEPAVSPRQILDSECAQGKCACPTTGCWNECNMRRFPLMYGIATPASPAVPAGFALVPIEPATCLKMGWAYLDAARATEPGKEWSFSHAGYRAMLAAVQAVPAPAPLAPSCRMQGGICACRSGGSFGGCAMERNYTTPFPESPATAAMHRLICQLASLKSCTPEAVNLLVEEAKRVMGQG